MSEEERVLYLERKLLETEGRLTALEKRVGNSDEGLIQQVHEMSSKISNLTYTVIAGIAASLGKEQILKFLHF